MPLTFPRDFTGLARWREPRLRVMHRQEMSRAAGGTDQGKDLGPALWMADWTSVPLPLNTADAVMGEFGSLRGLIHTFYLYPPARPLPAAMTGAESALAGVAVSAIGSDSTSLSLGGLPIGFTLTAGDYLSITTAVGGREFLRLVTGGIADASGIAADLAIEPFIRPTVAQGNAVALVRPLVEMRLEPGSLDDPFASRRHRSVTFKAVQVVL